VKLIAEELVKIYGRRRVVNGASLELERGEIVGLLGPNGAGKTTTFYIITGMIHPDAGRVKLDGRDITGCRCSAERGWASAICPRNRRCSANCPWLTT